MNGLEAVFLAAVRIGVCVCVCVHAWPFHEVDRTSLVAGSPRPG